MNPQSASAALKAACPQLVGSTFVQIWSGNQTKACQALVLRLDVEPASGRCAATPAYAVRLVARRRPAQERSPLFR